MVEQGHFAELKDILHKINGQPLCDGGRRQKLVFSATLTLPKKRKRKGKKGTGQDAGIGMPLSIQWEIYTVCCVSSVNCRRVDFIGWIG